MGAVWSFLNDSRRGVSLLLRGVSEANEDFAALTRRINSPAFPNPNSSTVFWQQNPIHADLVSIKSKALPQTADIVIIGSGISGASVAHTILTECSTLGVSKRVVLIEARTICSGATGRNGGHVKVAPYHEYSILKERFGVEIAKKIVTFQMLHLSMLLDFVKEEGFEEAELREVQTVDAFIDSNAFVKACEAVETLRREMPLAAEGMEVLDAELAREKFGFGEHCRGCISYKAGALWPYRFVTSLHASLLSAFTESYSIETETLATDISISDDFQKPFVVHTSRGIITASHVIHATDSFIPNLVPELKGKILPVRGHMTAQQPGKSFPQLNGERSWSIIGHKGFDYISQRPGISDSKSGLGAEIMLGGGILQSPGKGIDELGHWKDDGVDFSIICYLIGLLPVAFNKKTWGEDAEGPRVKSSWTGLMGWTLDMMPLVGKLPPSITKRETKTSAPRRNVADISPPAEWASAGFNGEGMVLAWLSGVATGLMVLGREQEVSTGICGRPDGCVADWLPDQFLCSEKRVSGMSVYELAGLL